MDYKGKGLGKCLLVPALLLSLFLSGVAVSYAVKAAHQHDHRVAELGRRIAALEALAGVPNEGAPKQGGAVISPSISEPPPASAPVEEASETDPFVHLPAWLARENPRDVQDLAVAVEADRDVVLGLRVRGPQGFRVGLTGEERVVAEEWLELLHEHQRFRHEFVLDALVTRNYSADFDTIEAAIDFARRNNPSAVEAIEDDRYAVIDLTPYHSEPSTLYNSDRRNELAERLGARSATLVSFERTPQ
ncbi:MAG: hypothetical protein AAF488_00895 [Planctomycetota bacterium]